MEDEMSCLRQRVAELEESVRSVRESEQALRAMVRGTSAAVGDEYFRVLVCLLAGVLGTRYAFVAECVEGGRRPLYARTLAFWVGSAFGRNFAYALSGTPCEEVLEARACCFYPGALTRLFPRDEVLTRWGAESYVGVPLFAATGETIGHLAVLDDKPMRGEGRLRDTLSLFALRAQAELQRRQRGALPNLVEACAWCRNLRTPGRGWHPPEAFISEQLGVSFTHGICRECATELRKTLEV